MKVAWDKDRAVFVLNDQKGHSGSLSLHSPDKISIFEVDTRDTPNAAYGPALYKEWKLTGKTSGTDAFEAANGREQRLTLILRAGATPAQARTTSATGRW